jgi:hypothetical protein
MSPSTVALALPMVHTAGTVTDAHVANVTAMEH